MAGQCKVILPCPRNLLRIEDLSCALSRGAKIYPKSVPHRGKIRGASPESKILPSLSWRHTHCFEKFDMRHYWNLEPFMDPKRKGKGSPTSIEWRKQIFPIWVALTVMDFNPSFCIFENPQVMLILSFIFFFTVHCALESWTSNGV